MTIDQAMQDSNVPVEEVLAMLKPTKMETFILVLQCFLGVIFPWMGPISDPDDW
ncbi:MAG: hypothetical protein AAB691_03710 [Patescibacteria group bacterium]